MIIHSSSLIIFGKINKLRILRGLYDLLYITKDIYEETVEEGILINAPDSRIIQKAIDNKEIKVLPLDKKYTGFSKELRKTYNQLGTGEADAIALALQKKQKEIIMDERLGRQVCKLYDLKPIGTLRIVLNAYEKNIIKEKELRELIKEIIGNKFRIGADVINEFWLIFDKLKKKKNR